jgi:two-component system, NtrC family, nitrogen regulation sensor histidine kinase NtrY
LGLAIVERIVFDHDGNIWFETQEDVGTTFIIDLPLGFAEA